MFALLDHLNIPLNIEAGGAGHAARGIVGFLNGKSPRDCLGIEFVRGPSFRQAGIVFVLQDDRAYLGALTAAGAF